MSAHQHARVPTPQQAPSADLPALAHSLPAMDATGLTQSGALGFQGLLGNAGVAELLQGVDPSTTQGTGSGQSPAPAVASDNKQEQPSFLSDWWSGIQQEGLGALFDPSGAVDRQSAQRELASRFDIVGDDFKGNKLPNQLTQEEFQQVARTWSDVRLGRSDLQLDAGMTDEQRAATMGDLGNILQTESGRALITDLAHTANPTSGQHHTTTLSATTNPLDIGASGFQNPGAINGQGTSSEVSYAPGQDVNIPGSTDAWNPYRSDVAVFHELVHARHNKMGTNLRTAEGEDMAAGTGAHTGDAITENAYRRERRLMGENVPNRDHY